MKNMASYEESVLNTVCAILIEDFGLSFTVNKKIVRTSLLESPFSLSAIQLYQLLMNLEEKFCVCFTADEIGKNGFFTIAEIQNLFRITKS